MPSPRVADEKLAFGRGSWDHGWFPVCAEGGWAMAAGRKSDQGSKEEIAKGMAEAGKGEVGKAGGEAAGKGGRGHGADPGKISQGMSEAGSGTGAGTKGLQGGAKSRSR